MPVKGYNEAVKEAYKAFVPLRPKRSPIFATAWASRFRACQAASTKGLRTNSNTKRYFIDRFPVLLPGANNKLSLPPVVTFTCCDGAHPSLARYVTHLRSYEEWDMRKAFVAACEQAGLEDVHIHPLRHLGPSILLAQGVSDSVVAKVTGHRSSALKRYQHLSESFRKQTVDLIATLLMPAGTDTRTDTPANLQTRSALRKGGKIKKSKGLDGRPVGTRTPDLYRVKVAL
jgi:Phage integrase family